MGRKFAMPDRDEPREIEKLIHFANSGRIYFEQLHLHPVKLGLTFTQEWMEWNPGTETMMVFQFIRGMVCCRASALTCRLLPRHFSLTSVLRLGLHCERSPSLYVIHGGSRL